MSSTSTSSSEEEENKNHLRRTSKRKRVSIVWTYFEKVDKLRVRCKICDKTQTYQGTTGNILRHLKTNHGIDATLKGQIDNPNIAKTVATMQRINQRHQDDNDGTNSRVKHKDDDNDPYSTYSNFENYLTTNEDPAPTKSHSVEEQRLLAEIEYFREKAAYYRMQKNLTALQARKIKYELDQLCTL